MFHSTDLCGATTTWKTFGEIAYNCTELKILNKGRTKGEILEYPLIQATNMVELNLSETLINDQFIEAIICAIDKHGIFAICVRGIKLQNEDISRLIEFYPNVADIGISTLCGLPEGTVSQEELPQLCPCCCSSSLATILSAKDANDGSWMEL
ncbi:unnamed protein product [Porites evermanni]|uniref:Uncharacterized protein n=1 Tax=Porites evermanni TaxID=104178 RepID=A0ABN8LNC2_9CNID|nr:unnamed protein product [Porites evermanni]